jgi:hypothetical protein
MVFIRQGLLAVLMRNCPMQNKNYSTIKSLYGMVIIGALLFLISCDKRDIDALKGILDKSEGMKY